MEPNLDLLQMYNPYKKFVNLQKYQLLLQKMTNKDTYKCLNH